LLGALGALEGQLLLLLLVLAVPVVLVVLAVLVVLVVANECNPFSKIELQPQPKEPCNMLRFFLLLSTAFASLQPCKELTVFTPRFLSAIPKQPKVNTNVSLFLTFSTPVTLTHGTVLISTVMNGFPVYEKSSRLCDHMRCPLSAGIHPWNYTFEWPTSIPGTYTTTITIDHNSVPHLCLIYIVEMPWF
jgi:hypothetical protein